MLPFPVLPMNSGHAAHGFRWRPSHLEFVAYFAVENWLAEPSKENDELLLRLLMSSDEAAVQVLVWSAYRNREVLGQRWWRLLYLALLWSGLSMIRPPLQRQRRRCDPLAEKVSLASNPKPLQWENAVVID